VTREPRASRPRFPGYGISEDREGTLPWSWATERLQRARNYWIATADADGRPLAMPVWALWFEDAIVFSTNPSSRKGRNLARDPRLAVHLESGDEVVILEGSAEPAAPDERIVDAYETKYDYRPTMGEGWYALRPSRAFAWRERDYPRSATRFDF
jgi:pyridoxine/pyridoxamine 5'-phosphate oxidase